MADQAFRNVFGEKLWDHEQDHRVQIQVQEIGKLKAEVQRLRSFSGADTFSEIAKNVGQRRQGLEDNTPLLYDDTTGNYQIATGGNSQAPEMTARQQATTAANIMAALIAEFGEEEARGILESASLETLERARRVTLKDLDRIQQAIQRRLEPAIKAAADLDLKIQAEPTSEQSKAAFDRNLSANRSAIMAALDNNPRPQRSQHGMIRASLAFDACQRVRDNAPGALRDFARLVGANPEQIPRDEEQREQWMIEQLHDRFFVPPQKLGLDPVNNRVHGLLVKLATEARENEDALPLMRYFKLKSVLSNVLDQNNGANRKEAARHLIFALQDLRHGANPLSGRQAQRQRDEALKAAESRLLGTQLDDHNAPRTNKRTLLRELTGKASSSDRGVVTPEQVAELQELDRETPSLQLRRAGQKLEADQVRIERSNIGNLMNNAPDQVQRPLMSGAELKSWIKNNVLNAMRLQRAVADQDRYAFVRTCMPHPQEPGNPLDPDQARLIQSIALADFKELTDTVAKLMFPGQRLFGAGADPTADAQRESVTEVVRGMLDPALEALSNRGDWLSSADRSRIRFQGQEYRSVKRLGKGSYGTANLYEAVRPDSQGRKAQVVVKEFHNKGKSKEDQSRFNELQKKEIRNHLDASLQDAALDPDQMEKGRENVLELKGFLYHLDDPDSATGTFMTVTPVASGGELRKVLSRINRAERAGDISTGAANLLKRRLIGQSITGMAHIQGQRQMIHSDLKGANVFVTADGTAKVADFGLSSSGLESEKTGGTPGYMAPEVVSHAIRRGQQRDAQQTGPNIGSDVWSMGAMMRRELFDTKVLPGAEQIWRGGDDEKNNLLRQTVNVAQQPDYQIYEKGRPEYRTNRDRRGREKLRKVRDIEMLGAQEKLINAMMDPDPKKRPTMAAVSEHEYFNDPKLFEPELQQLTAAIIDGKNNSEIKRLGNEVENIYKR